jgi:NitT/TauT family transport system permease protein
MMFNLTGLLLAEMYASRAGLGQAIATWGEDFKLTKLLAAILLISVVSILFNESVRWLELKCEHWRS